ncbi:MAG: Rubrerythrin [Fibrobacter sp.]|nr:Rubrerythrin [Fibrobacter sp.]
MPEFVNPYIGMMPGRKMTKGELLRALRLSLAAEEEATHIYEAIADACDNELAREVLLDIAKEERVHKGEFQRVIELLLPEETELMKEGASEVEEIRENLRNNNNSSKNGITPTVGNLKGNYI